MKFIIFQQKRQISSIISVVCIPVIIFSILLLPVRLLAQNALQSNFLIPRTTLSPDLNYDYPQDYGDSVVMDGDTIAVSQYDRVYIYRRTSDAWEQQQVIQLTNGCSSLGLSGGYLVIGIPGNEHVQVYSRESYESSWTQKKILVASDGQLYDRFGESVDIDSGSIAVGAYLNDAGGSERGKVYVYDIPDNLTNTWPETKLTAPAGESENGDEFGWGVCISGDLVGVSTYKNNPGYIFRRSGNSWSFESLTPVAITHLDLHGDQAAMISWSNELLMYGYQNGAWIHRHTVTSEPESRFGDPYFRPITIEENLLVATAIEGGPTAKSFSVQVYESDGELWELQKVLTPPDAIADEAFGTCVSISGNSVLVGAPNPGTSSPPPGNAYFYSPGYEDPVAIAKYVRSFLYVPDASETIFFPDNVAAFRYKHLLYEMESGELRAKTEQAAELFNSADIARSKIAETELMKGLQLSPESDLLKDLLLEIYYDRCVGSLIQASQSLSGAERIRHSPPSIPGGLVIDDEIEIYNQSLNNYRNVLQDYFDLIHDDLGFSATPAMGYQIFHDLVPTRGLQPACTWSGSELIPVSGSTEKLFVGYKDLVLLCQALSEYGRSAAEFARFLSPIDPGYTENLLTEANRFIYIHTNLLQGIFPALDPDDPLLENSGYSQTMATLDSCLMSFEDIRQQLISGAGQLGFEDDFLMLVQNFNGQSGEIFDSFDAFEGRLDPGNLSSPLRYAIDLERSARDTYADYRGYQDQLETQLNNISGTIEDRLFQITGAYPDSPEYKYPENNDGCEIWLQLSSIELAQLQIRRNKTEIRNLEEQVRIEVERSQSVQETIVSYGNQQASLTEWIGHINAAQAFADGMADAFSAKSIGEALFSGANAAVQASGEEAKGQIQAEKERLAAQERAELEGIENAARIETMMLGMNTLAIDSMEAAILLKQELGRLASLQREKQALESELAESQSSLATRYFADPTHRLRQQHQTLLANLSFDDAQKWLFFMARALEYKWNVPFANYFYLGRKWSTGTLFKLRNAYELEQFYYAMVSFNSLVQLPQDDYFDWFSVREDFLGFIEKDSAGNPLYYSDPANPNSSGAVMTAQQAFQSYLRTKMDAGDNIRLEFSTRREIPGGTFYRGPRFAEDGSVTSAGLFLDKIKWLKINLPGNHTLGRSQITGELAYGGTGFIRNFDVGNIQPDRPDRLQNEETAYSTRYWYFHAPTARWRFSESLSSPVNMQLSTDPRVPPSVGEIDVFKERSVATTGWKLTIPTQDLGVLLLDIDELDDIEIYFYHYAVSRQISSLGAQQEGSSMSTEAAARPFPYILSEQSFHK